jgi:ElaB/YqjD/DUF883 family membrane-anchored ribosome-binding protein
MSNNFNETFQLTNYHPHEQNYNASPERSTQTFNNIADQSDRSDPDQRNRKRKRRKKPKNNNRRSSIHSSISNSISTFQKYIKFFMSKPISAIGTCTAILVIVGIIVVASIAGPQATAKLKSNFYSDKLGGHPWGWTKTKKSIDQDNNKCQTSSSWLANKYDEIRVQNQSEFDNSNKRRKRATSDIPTRKSRIVGGAATKIQEFPWQVSLQSMGSHVCGGSVILNDWVVTAAHCTDVFDRPSDWTAYAGLDRSTLKEQGSKREVKAIIQHPNFNQNDFDNDISLLKLKSPFTYTEKIQPICVPTSNLYYMNEAITCFVSGYGTIFAGGPASDALNSVKVPILKNNLCNDWFSESTQGEAKDWVYSNMVCAGYENGHLDGCQGDSGGPLQCVKTKSTKEQHFEEVWYLSGAVSWGIGCAEAKKPGVYTRIGYFEEWIWEVITEYEQNN